MFIQIKNKLFSLLQLLLVIVYIIFEELIWEGVARPIYTFIHSLRILKMIESKLNTFDSTIILTLFVLLLMAVEGFGIYAGMLFVQGEIFLAVTLYLSKIPIAAFTFWVFKVTQDKLMSFSWFKKAYEKLQKMITWIKELKLYQDTIVVLNKTKERIKELKQEFFSDKSLFIEKLKKLYRDIKTSLNRN